MTLPGETAGFNGAQCSCGQKLNLQVCMSAAGHYLGYFCLSCGPYSRETGYYRARDEAQAALRNLNETGQEPENRRV